MINFFQSRDRATCILYTLQLLNIGLFIFRRTGAALTPPPETDSEFLELINDQREICSAPEINETGFLSFLNISKHDDWKVSLCDMDEQLFGYKSGQPFVLADVEILRSIGAAVGHGRLGTSLREIKRMPRLEIPLSLKNASVPKQFDARLNWPKCHSIRLISSQGDCHGCWATAVTSALDDRLCIFSESKDFFSYLSAQDLLECCPSCGTCDGLCGGGMAEMAYDYFVTTGIVTGSVKNSDYGCVPYGLRSLVDGRTSNPLTAEEIKVINAYNFKWSGENCRRTCTNPYYWTEYKDDKLKGKAWYILTSFDKDGSINFTETERNIQVEIMTNGTVTVTIETYADLQYYTSGIYNTSRGNLLGYHVMRCIGWGVDNVSQQPYWILANSWGRKWGQNGFMRILRGLNVAGVETRVSAGIPGQYNRVFTPHGQKEGIIVETARSKAMPYAGISDAWRAKLNVYSNDCTMKAVAYKGEENWAKDSGNR